MGLSMGCVARSPAAYPRVVKIDVQVAIVGAEVKTSIAWTAYQVAFSSEVP